MKKPLALFEVYRLLEPGPVVLVATADAHRRNVMTMSWQTMLDFEPPLLAAVVSNRNFSFELLDATGECVIAIPTVELARTVVKIGNCSGRDLDKFQKFKIATEPARRVKAPLLVDCYANLECKVIDTAMVEKYNLFVLEVVAAWRNPAYRRPRTIHHMGRGLFVVDGEQLRLPSKMK